MEGSSFGEIKRRALKIECSKEIKGIKMKALRY
jgi:hypothetical protein